MAFNMKEDMEEGWLLFDLLSAGVAVVRQILPWPTPPELLGMLRKVQIHRKFVGNRKF